MSGLIRDSLEILRPYLHGPIFSDESVEKLFDAAAHCGDVTRLGFECRLDPKNDRVDFFQAIFQKEGEDRIFSEHLSRASGPAFDNEAWQRLKSYCVDWTDPGSLIHGHIDELWLEYDLDDTSDSAIPSLFIGINPSSFSTEKSPAIIETIVRRLQGEPLSEDAFKNLKSCFRSLPNGARLLHVGIMLSRTVDALRVNIQRIHADNILPFLERIEWTGNSDECAELISVGKICCDDIRIDLDVGPMIYPQIGLEFFIGDGPNVRDRWKRLLQRLTELGHCDEKKGQMLLDWPGHIGPPNVKKKWPSALLLESLTKKWNQFGVFARTLNHVKVNLSQDHRPEAKAYLGYLHSWVSPTPAERDFRPSA